MRGAMRALLLVCLMASTANPCEGQGPSPELATSRIERLAGLGRLWGAVKYFHPSLAYRDIDWDAALIAAIPKVRAASTAEEYRAAIDGMLTALDDPATRATRDDPALPARTAAELSRVLDGVLVIDCRTASERLMNADYGAANRAVSSYLAGSSKGIVFDCRTTGLGANSPLMFGYEFALGAASLVFKGAATLATYRERQHSGYAPRVGSTSGGYWSGLTTTTARIIEGRRTGDPVPLAFIVDAGTPVMREIIGLQAAGFARIIEADDPSAAPGSHARHAVRLPGGITARVRIAELVSPNGAPGWHPDVKVPASAGPDAAVTVAIESLKAVPIARLSSGAAGAVPRVSPDRFYSDMKFPTAEYRLLALFRFWNVVRYFFPYRHLMDQDWNDALAAFIPLFESNQSAFDYETTVMLLAKRLQDSHVNVYPVNAIAAALGDSVPPITVSSIEGTTVIVALRDPAAAQMAGLKIGDAILAVDGQPIAARRSELERFAVASTPQSMRHKVDALVLRGASDKPARLRVRASDGVEREIEIARSASISKAAYPPERTQPSIYGMLPSGYGYVDLARLPYADADRAIDALIDTPAIIFDMRGYPNGTGFVLAPRLMKGDKPVAGALFRRPVWQGSTLSEEVSIEAVQNVIPSEKRRYAGKVVMLINEQAISQAEHTCLAFSAATDVTFVGSPTTGANGDITNFALPGGLTVVFTGHDVRHGDGRQLQRVGVQPQVRAGPTIKGVREGRDEVLEAAIDHLKRAPH